VSCGVGHRKVQQIFVSGVTLWKIYNIYSCIVGNIIYRGRDQETQLEAGQAWSLKSSSSTGHNFREITRGLLAFIIQAALGNRV